MSKYRDRLRIIADILMAADSRAKKTKIMYGANLSHSLLEKYLDEVMMIGFLRADGNEYEVTEKGKLFLEKYVEFSAKFSNIKKELNGLRFERETLEEMCKIPSGSDLKSDFCSVRHNRSN
jgi:predicted transcriptional regulator